jgi:hypothetical protein
MPGDNNTQAVPVIDGVGTTEVDARPSSDWAARLANAAQSADNGEEFEPDDDSDDDEEYDDEASDDASEGGETQKRPTVADKKAWGQLQKTEPAKIAIKERIARREGMAKAAAGIGNIQEQLRATAAEKQRLLDERQQSAAEFREKFEKGDVNGALKALGADTTLTDLTKKFLQAKKGLQGGADSPRVAALEGQINALMAKEEQRIAQLQQAQQDAQRQAQEEQDVADLTEEIAALPYVGVEALAKAPGFARLVYDDILKGGDTEEAVQHFRGTYQNLLNDLYAAAVAGALDMPGAAEPGKRRRPIEAPVSPPTRNVVPKQGNQARGARSALPDELRHNGRKRWDAILRGKM